MFRIAIIVNPIAGLGGRAGLKGSDNPKTKELAHDLGISDYAQQRVSTLLSLLTNLERPLEIHTPIGSMGIFSHQDRLEEAGHELIALYDSPISSTNTDTMAAAKEARSRRVDLLLFAGGDGTARDICSVVGSSLCVLGIPSGVKMHSGVFAVTPKAAASIIDSMSSGRLVAALVAEVRDIDESAFAQGQVKTKHYGEMMVPDDQLLVQTVKCSGLPDDEFVLQEIAAFFEETLEDDVLYLLGSGGTLKELKSAIGIDSPTLLGVDAWFNGSVVCQDANEPQVFELVNTYDRVKIILSVIGGQGIVLGRGNQQLSARVLQTAGIDSIQFVGTPAKIQALQGRALKVDSGSEELDSALAGSHSILTGYDQYMLYHIE